MNSKTLYAHFISTRLYEVTKNLDSFSVKFEKADKSIREMKCKTDGADAVGIIDPSTFIVTDLEKDAMRSFKIWKVKEIDLGNGWQAFHSFLEDIASIYNCELLG